MERETVEVLSVLKLHCFFPIKGFGLPLLFIYSPTVMKEIAGWDRVAERKRAQGW